MTPFEKVKVVWPTCSVADVIWIAPLGSRPNDNELIFNRRLGQVITGWLGTKSCFFGTLVELRQKVESDYGSKIKNNVPHAERRRQEYVQAIEFLEALPRLEGDTGSPESGLSWADLGGRDD